MSFTVGSKLPELRASALSGEFKRSKFAGKNLVLYFYPKDNTPGCSVQAADFRDHHQTFVKLNTTVVGVSRDSLKSHENFKTKFDLPFDLISDADETLCAQFAVMKMKNMYGKQVRGIERSTFVIDGSGTLIHEWRGLKVPGHVAEVLAYVKTL